MDLLTNAYNSNLLDIGRLSDVILYEISSQVSNFYEKEQNEIVVSFLNQAIYDCDDPQISKAFDLTTMSDSREFFLYLSEEQVSMAEFLNHAQYEEFPFTHVCMVDKNKFVFFTMDNIEPFVDVAEDYLIQNLVDNIIDKALYGIDRG